MRHLFYPYDYVVFTFYMAGLNFGLVPAGTFWGVLWVIVAILWTIIAVMEYMTQHGNGNNR